MLARAATPRGEGFGNGRFARNVLESAIGRHAWRLRDVAEPTADQLRELLPEDLSDGVHADGSGATAPAPDGAGTPDDEQPFDLRGPVDVAGVTGSGAAVADVAGGIAADVADDAEGTQGDAVGGAR